MNEGLSPERLARAVLCYLADPDDRILGGLLTVYTADELVAAIRAGRLPEGVARQPAAGLVAKAMKGWRARLRDVPEADQIAAGLCDGVRLICPDDPEWPVALDVLGARRPYALWVRGCGDLLGRTVAIVGSRSASGYGSHVAAEMAAELAESGWTIVSGGAYGIDAAAHRGALAVRGSTIAVLACGVDVPYPVGHASLFETVMANGLVISEWPPGSRPARLRFLVRNRVIAALGAGTVIVEAGERSGALNTARHAAELNKPLMAVPGPVTSMQSAGCHQIIRDWNGCLVTCAADVLAIICPIGAARASLASGLGEPDSGAGDQQRRLRDELDLEAAKVLDAFPARGTVGPAVLASGAGLDVDVVLSRLGRLLALGFIEPSEGGWRLTRKARL